MDCRSCISLVDIDSTRFEENDAAHKSGQLMGISRVADEAQCNEVNSPMDDDTSRVAEKNIRCNGAPIHLIR